MVVSDDGATSNLYPWLSAAFTDDRVFMFCVSDFRSPLVTMSAAAAPVRMNRRRHIAPPPRPLHASSRAASSATAAAATAKSGSAGVDGVSSDASGGKQKYS
jgi:hypothetical protein